MNHKENLPSRLWLPKVGLRFATAHATELLFPHQLKEVSGGLAKAQELLNRNFGLVILFNHFSIRDPLEIFKDVIFIKNHFLDRQLVIPIAAHQYQPVLRELGKVFGIEIYPVVNQHSVDKGFAGPERKGEGLVAYIAAAATALSAGGLVLLSPQAGREARLGQSRPPTVEFFLRQMQRKEVDNLGYFFVGLGIDGEDDYDAKGVKDFSFGRTFNVLIGDCLTQAELIEEATAKKISIDNLIDQKFIPLVPPEYFQPNI